MTEDHSPSPPGPASLRIEIRGRRPVPWARAVPGGLRARDVERLVRDHGISTMAALSSHLRRLLAARRTHKPLAMRRWQQEVAGAALQAMTRARMPRIPKGHAVRVHIDVTTDTRGGDGDRYENAILDALSGVVYEDDAQVRAGSWALLAGAKAMDAGIVVLVTDLGPI